MALADRIQEISRAHDSANVWLSHALNHPGFKETPKKQAEAIWQALYYQEQALEKTKALHRELKASGG